MIESIEIRYTKIVRELERLRAEAAAKELTFDNDDVEQIYNQFKSISKILNISD